MKKYLLVILTMCMVMFGASSAFAEFEEEAVELITGNDNASWISLDNPSYRITYRSNRIRIKEVIAFNPQGYTKVAFYYQGDPMQTLEIQYNADENKYYAFVYVGPNENLDGKSGWYRNI